MKSRRKFVEIKVNVHARDQAGYRAGNLGCGSQINLGDLSCHGRGALRIELSRRAYNPNLAGGKPALRAAVLNYEARCHVRL